MYIHKDIKIYIYIYTIYTSIYTIYTRIDDILIYPYLHKVYVYLSWRKYWCNRFLQVIKAHFMKVQRPRGDMATSLISGSLEWMIWIQTLNMHLILEPWPWLKIFFLGCRLRHFWTLVSKSHVYSIKVFEDFPESNIFGFLLMLGRIPGTCNFYPGALWRKAFGTDRHHVPRSRKKKVHLACRLPQHLGGVDWSWQQRTVSSICMDYDIMIRAEVAL